MTVEAFLALLVVGLAGYRLTRVVTSDTISDPFRAWVYAHAYAASGYDSRTDSEQARVRHRGWHWFYMLVSCPFCLGFWVTLGVWSAWKWGPDWCRSAVAAIAAVGVQAFIASRRDA